MDTVRNVFCYYWKNTEVFEGSKKVSEMRIYGVDELGLSVCIRVYDICTRIVLDFGHQYDLETNYLEILRILQEHIYNSKDRKTIKLVKKHRLYWFTTDSSSSTDETTVERKKYPFIEISFSSQGRLYYFVKNLPNINFPVTPKVHELNASPEIQFIVQRDLYACGWLTVSKNKPLANEDKQTFCDIEFYVHPSQLSCVDLTINPKMSIMSWDIEANCKDIANTPGEHAEDCVFQISCVFSNTDILFNEKSEELYEKFLLTLGECDPIENVCVYRFKTERDLIIGFSELIKAKRPKILTGWNLFNFDVKFMVKRAERNQCLAEFLDFSLVNTETDVSQGNETTRVRNIKWASKAMMTTDVVYIDAEGILAIDLIELVRKDYKLDSYSLNAVSKEFLKQEKHDIGLSDIFHAFRAYKENLPDAKDSMTLVGDYCVQDSNLVMNLFHKLQAWVGLIEMARTTNTPVMTIHLHGQQKRYFNQIYKFCRSKNIVVEYDAYKSPLSESYTGAYVFDPNPGLYEYVVSLDFNSLYPSIIIAYNIDYTSLIHKESLPFVPKHMVDHMQWEDHVGCEHDQNVIKKKILSDTINMYELQISDLKKNKHFGGIAAKKKILEYNKRLKEFRNQRAAVDKKISKRVICQSNSYHFVKKEYLQGVVPTIIQNLLKQRKIVRSQMKCVTDKSLLALLNKRQLSLKIAANSMYGAMGVRSGALPFMPLAMCVTHTGRESVKRAAEILETLNGSIVYGDTDSSYVIFKDIVGDHETMCRKIWDRAISVAKEISSRFPDPMNIEFEEEIYYKYLILTKKRYIYLPCNKEGVFTSKIKHKGVLLSRRDNSKFIKDVYEQCVIMAFDGKSNCEVSDSLNTQIIQLMSGESTDFSVFKITKSVNDYNSCKITFDEQIGKYKMGVYIVPNPDSIEDKEERLAFCKNRLPAQVQLEIKMVENGEERAEGARIEYLVVQNSYAKKQSEKIVNYANFLKMREIYKPDYLYYIQRLVEPLDQLFRAVWSDETTVNSVYKQHSLKMQLCKDIRKLFSPNFRIVKEDSIL